MAYRNIKPGSVQGFDAVNMNDKMQSSTLKRQPNPDWSKADLLRLLSYFEGELQARDITIATLKAEKAKQLLYQAKYGKFGLGDPFVALQRDSEGKNDAGFDENAIKSMYDNQLAQLENLIATQRKAQLKMREQLGNSEKRFHKLCAELEDEKKKHAQDTAQGDDVTYMLEKERERLKAEIDFEKSQNKKLEKDLKKTLASLEEERANATRHKQVAVMLIKERKNLIERIVSENHLRDEMESALTDGKSKIQNMAEGLAEESKKSLRMEVVIEKQSNKFDSERETLRVRLEEEEKQTNILRAEVAWLLKQLESLHQQLRISGSSPSNIPIRSSVSPARAVSPSVPDRSGAMPQSSGSTLHSGCPSFNSNAPHSYIPISASGVRPAGLHHAHGDIGGTFTQPSTTVTDGGRIGSNSPDREVIYRPEYPSAMGRVAARATSPGGLRLVSMNTEHEMDMSSAARAANVSPGSSASIITATGSKNLFHTGGGVGSQASSQLRRSPGIGSTQVSPLGRGTPPPIPPNKPNFVSPAPSSGKLSLTPKISVVGPSIVVQTAGKEIYSGQYSSHNPVKTAQPYSRAVQIPVSVVGSSSPTSNPSGPVGTIASVRTQVRETSPSAVKKTSQVCVNAK